MAAPAASVHHQNVITDDVPPDRTRHDLVLSPATLATALVLASLFPAWALLRGLYLSFHIAPTAVALYAERVGHALMGPAAIGTLVLLAVAVGIRWTAPLPSSVLTAGVAVTVSTVLGGVGLAWVVADRAMHPYGRELRAVAAYEPPPGAIRRFDSREASDHPAVTRYWQAAGAEADVCRAAVERFNAWADPGSSQRATSGCYYKAERGPHHVELIVQDYGMAPATASISVKVRRT